MADARTVFRDRHDSDKFRNPVCRGRAMPVQRSAAAVAAVYLVDQGLQFAERASRCLRPLGLAVSRCASAASLADAYDPGLPGCVVAGFGSPGLDALQLSRMLCVHPCPPPLVGVGRPGDVGSAVVAFKGGVVDFLVAPLQPAALIDSVHSALERDRQQRRRACQRAALAQRFAQLTQRERQVFAGLAADLTAKRIAAWLGISPRTAEHHREGVMRKMQAHSWHELLVMAMLLDVWQPEERAAHDDPAHHGMGMHPHLPAADAPP